MTGTLGNLNEAVGILNSDGILLLQTDTLPGLHARADSVLACSRIQELKGRGEDKPMVVLAANVQQAFLVCGELSVMQEKCLDHHWPGPFSFILPAATGVSLAVTGALGTVAVRVPAQKELRLLIEAVGFPLASTSANFSGEPPCAILSDAVALFSGVVAHYKLSDSPREILTGSQPSALVDLTASPAVQLREGPLPFLNL